MRPGILVPAALALAVIWGGLAVMLALTEPYIMTPDKVASMMGDAPWRNGRKPAAAVRKAFLEQVAGALGRLDFEQQRQLREDHRAAAEDLFFAMTEEEQKWFLAQTVEKQFQTVMKAFKAMNPEERRRVVNQTRADMRRNAAGTDALDTLGKDDDKAFETIIQEGIGSYYQGSDDKRKKNLGPLLQQMQARMRRM